MALKLTITAFGIEVPDAYHRIDEILIVKKDKMQICVNSYSDASQPAPFYKEVFEFPYNATGANPIAQGYVALKATERFASSEDC